MSRTNVSMPAKFVELSEYSRAHNETNDCAVKAIVVVTGAPYAVVHKMLAEAGRKSRKGSSIHAIGKVVHDLGFEARTWLFSETATLIASYAPKAPTWYKGITTSQVKAYNKKWRALPVQNMLLFSHSHVSAYKDGEVIDWAHNKAKRIWMVWEITKRA